MHQLATSTTVDISVLVPVLNEGRTIREVVHAMTSQQFAGTIELLFADGRSSDDTRAQLEDLRREDSRIRVLDNPRRGVASGLNVCLGAARGRYVARMDGHALYPPTYLQDGVERLQRSEGGTDGAVAWVAGPQVPMSGGRIAAAIAAALATPLGRGGSRRWSSAAGAAEEYELDTGVFCGVWRRADVLAKGGWDEGWICNEDSELAARFHDAGQRIVCVPSMAARYFPRSSLPALWRQYRLYGMYRARTARRHPASLRRSAVLPPLLVLGGGVATIARGRARRLSRAGQAAYAASLLIATAEAWRGREAASEEGLDSDALALVPVAIATMQVAHGVGFLQGCGRWGVPWRALWQIVSKHAGSKPYSGPVEAPSLASRDD